MGTSIEEFCRIYDVTIKKTKYVVCPRCKGNGSHTNPSIDGNGLSDEYLADIDFMEDYMAGNYDVTCHRCNGLRVVKEVDWHHVNKETRKLYDEYLEEAANYEAECAAERRWGA